MRARLAPLLICFATALTSAGAAPQTGSNPSLPQLLAAAGNYVAEYERAFGAMVSEERYEQTVNARAAGTGPVHRVMTSDVMTFSSADAGWIGYRDTQEVDGERVGDQSDRLLKLVADPSRRAVEDAKRVTEESAFYHIGSNARPINVPTTALIFLRRDNQARSTFEFGGMKVLNKQRVALLTFKETGADRLIPNIDHAAATGRFWIDPDSGRVVQTEFSLVSRTYARKVLVEYADQPSLALWAPVRMVEQDAVLEEQLVTLRNGSTHAPPTVPAVVDGRAEYRNFRRFEPKAELIAIGASVALSSPDIGRTPPGRSVPGYTQAQAWIRLAKAHRIGQIDEPLRTLASWSPAHIEQINEDARLIHALIAAAAKGERRVSLVSGHQLVLEDLTDLLGLPADALDVPVPGVPVAPIFVEPGQHLEPLYVANPDGRPRFEIAKVMVQVAMLHTDLAMVWGDDVTKAGLQMAQMPSSAVRLVDGQRTSVPNLGIHWDTARVAMDLVEPTPRGGPLARDWYDATAEYLLAHRDYADAVPHLERGTAVLPRDSRLAWYLGAAFENLAVPSVQAAVDENNDGIKLDPPAILLKKAETHLRAALDLDPQLSEAALRLSRVLQLAGRHDEALERLTRIERSLPRPDLQYCAALFAGLALESRGRDVEAQAAFERALALFPGAQSPRLALAQLAWRTTGQAEALAHVRALDTANRAADPWWTYDVSFTVNMPARVAALRTSVAEILR